MSHQHELEELIKNNGGLIRTRQAEEHGVPRKYLSMMSHAGHLERLSQGIYLSPDAYEDRLFRLQFRCEPGVFSHETALFLLGLSDREPQIIMMTVPSGYNAQHLTEEPMKMFYIRKELLGLGRSTAETAFKRSVQCYDRERTLCDVLRSRSKMDPALVNQAFKIYLKSTVKNIPLLFDYSSKLGVLKQVRNYLEVLL